MSTKPDVRPPVAGHPDSAKASSGRPDPNKQPADRHAIRDEVARRLFQEKDGDLLLHDLRTVEGTLRMYEQDVERGLYNESPEKFRWRVTPSTASRLRKERKQLRVELDKLFEECRTEAEKIVSEAYEFEKAASADQAAAEAASPPPETTPTVVITQRPASAKASADRPATAETEAAPNAPVSEAA